MKNNFSFAFFGTTKFSEMILIYLLKNKIYSNVIFSTPKNFNISYSKTKVNISNYGSLKKIAKKFNIQYYEIKSFNQKKTKNFQLKIKKYNLDIMLFIGWYYIVPKSLRSLAKYGAWGIHASLLPKYAGGAPLSWAIINGEKKTGVTLFKLESGIDNGDIIEQKSFFINYDDTINDVYKKAEKISKKMLLNKLKQTHEIKFTPQKINKIKIYPQRNPDDGQINWNIDAKGVYDFVRAQTIPYPCAFSNIQNHSKKIKLLECKVHNIKDREAKPGEIISKKNKILVKTKNKFIEILKIKVENKRYLFKNYVRRNNLIGRHFISKKN